MSACEIAVEARRRIRQLREEPIESLIFMSNMKLYIFRSPSPESLVLGDLRMGPLFPGCSPLRVTLAHDLLHSERIIQEW